MKLEMSIYQLFNLTFASTFIELDVPIQTGDTFRFEIPKYGMQLIIDSTSHILRLNPLLNVETQYTYYNKNDIEFNVIEIFSILPHFITILTNKSVFCVNSCKYKN